MKKLLSASAVLLALGACASTADHPGLQETRAMTDANGKPIDPGPGALSPGFGIGIGLGGWGGARGGGIGVGLGF
jgi:hypothetical protein